jgi:hypothetical protein
VDFGFAKKVENSTLQWWRYRVDTNVGRGDLHIMWNTRIPCARSDS